MRTFMHRHSKRSVAACAPLVPKGWRRLALVPVVLALSACGDIARLVTPGSKGPNGPAMIAFTASVPLRVSSAVDVVTLNVTSSYRRTDGTLVRIGSQIMTLTSDAVQAVPIPVDVGTCLADATRDAGGASSTNGSCAVVLTLDLVINGIVVDRQVVGPLRLQPGATTTVAQPVTLNDLAAVEVQSGGSIVSPSATVQAFLGTPLLLSARVLDARGQVVTNRPITWNSDVPTVATVDPNTGVVTAVSVGTAKITANTGTVSATATVNVLRAPAALTVTVGAGGGAGTVRSTPAGVDCRVAGGVMTGTCTFAFPGDAAVSLVSTANAGSVFSAWGDACSAASIGASCQLMMSQVRSARVQFAALRRVSVSPASGSTGRGRVTGANGFDCRVAASATTGTCAVDIVEGTALQLTASPEALTTGGTRQFFAGWGGACASATGATCTVTPTTTDLTTTAQFFDVQQIAVSVAGNGGGMVTGGSTISCVRSGGATTGTCAETATFGTSVTLTAVADAQSNFAGWAGACTGTSTTCTTSLTAIRNVSATFTRRQVTMTVNLVGPGSGSVSVNGTPCVLPSGQPTTTCTTTFDAGATVTLSANAAAGSNFTAFSGACSGTGNCALVLNQSQSVSATFTISRFPLTVTLSGTGAGAVVLPDGSSCSLALGQTSTTCTAQVNAGTNVSMAATPTIESTFEGFTGDCSGRGGCSFVMTAPRMVGVAFTRKQVPLTLQLRGPGGGSVSVNGAVACTISLGQSSASCTRQIDYGTSVSLTATPTFESLFNGFDGDCAGGSCAVVMTAPRSVGATFTRRQVSLALQLRGPGGGSVSINGVVACTITLGQTSANCTRLIDFGSSVSLTASPTIESSFTGFDGDCTGASCTVTATADRVVGATFSRRLVPLVLTLSGPASGSVRINGITECTLLPGVASISCTKMLEYGATVTITGRSTSSFNEYVLSGDCGGGLGDAPTCSLVMTSPRSVGIAFR